MQTFLPVASFAETATILDYRRLGKQRVEAFQILETLAGISVQWRNHPAVVMWRGCEFALGDYGMTMCREWRQRGYTDNMEARFLEVLIEGMSVGKLDPARNGLTPWWIGSERFHQSHRSQLLRKDPEYYRKYWPYDRDDLDYVWPDPWPEEALENA
jgi:hypothetical protein